MVSSGLHLPRPLVAELLRDSRSKKMPMTPKPVITALRLEMLYMLMPMAKDSHSHAQWCRRLVLYHTECSWVTIPSIKDAETSYAGVSMCRCLCRYLWDICKKPGVVV